MIRNMMKTLLCLALALMLPLCALADTQHTLTIIPGDELAGVEAVKDLLDVASLTLTTGEKAAALTLTMDGAEIGTNAMSADEAGLFVQSGLISDDVLYATWDDTFAFLAQTMKNAIEAEAAANGTQADPETLQALDTIMAAYKQQVITTVSTGVSVSDAKAAAVTPEEAMAKVEEMFKDDPAMVSMIKDILDRVVIEDGEFADEARDTATRKMSLTLTGKDMAPVCDTQYMRNMMEQTLKAEDSTLEGEALTKKVDEMLAQIKRVYEEGDIELTMEAYSADNDETLVGMEMGLSMAFTDASESGEAENVNMTMNINYDRLTGESGVSHKGDMNIQAAENGKNVTTADVVFDGMEGADGVTDGMLAMMADGTQITVQVHGEDEGETRVRTLGLYTRSGATAIIAPAASDRPMLTLNLVSGDADAKLLEAIQTATPDTAVSVLKLNATEMQALLGDMQTRLMQALYTMISQLPSSVMTLVQSGMITGN